MVSKYSKVENPVLVITNYEEQDDDDKLKTVCIINQNNYNNIVSDSHSKSDIEQAGENVFDEDIIKEVKVTPKTTINANVV